MQQDRLQLVKADIVFCCNSLPWLRTDTALTKKRRKRNAVWEPLLSSNKCPSVRALALVSKKHANMKPWNWKSSQLSLSFCLSTPLRLLFPYYCIICHSTGRPSTLNSRLKYVRIIFKYTKRKLFFNYLFGFGICFDVFTKTKMYEGNSHDNITCPKAKSDVYLRVLLYHVFYFGLRCGLIAKKPFRQSNQEDHAPSPVAFTTVFIDPRLRKTKFPKFPSVLHVIDYCCRNVAKFDKKLFSFDKNIFAFDKNIFHSIKIILIR